MTVSTSCEASVTQTNEKSPSSLAHFRVPTSHRQGGKRTSIAGRLARSDPTRRIRPICLGVEIASETEKDGQWLIRRTTPYPLCVPHLLCVPSLVLTEIVRITDVCIFAA